MSMSIDERLQFLLQSTESLHATVQQIVDENAKKAKRTDARIEAHESEIPRFRRMMRAVLTAWLEEDGENGKQP